MIDSSLISMESFRGEGRIIPRTRNNHGGVEHKPDVPGVEMGTVGGLRVFISNGSHEIPEVGLMQSEPAIDTNRRTHRLGVAVTPLCPVPLTPFDTTSHGGRRTYGGGTSKEALRRAKDKTKVNLGIRRSQLAAIRAQG